MTTTTTTETVLMAEGEIYVSRIAVDDFFSFRQLFSDRFLVTNLIMPLSIFRNEKISFRQSLSPRFSPNLEAKRLGERDEIVSIAARRGE